MTDHIEPKPQPSILDHFPGGEKVVRRATVQSRIIATLLAAAWPPILVTFPLWPPYNLFAGLDTDWRIILLVVGLVAAPIGLARLAKAKRPNNVPWTGSIPTTSEAWTIRMRESVAWLPSNGRKTPS